MRYLKLFGLAIVAIVAMAAMPMAAAASPETPEELPSIAAEEAQTGTAGITEFNGVLTVKCTTATNASGRNVGTAPLGLFHITFKECTTAAGAIKCTGLNELTAGVILVLGTWHLWWDRKKEGSFTGLTTATVFLNEELHFSCATTLIRVKGVQVCLDLNPTTSSTTHEVHCEASGTKQTEEYCEKEKENTCSTGWVVPVLLSASGTGEFKESAELGLGTVVAAKEIFADI